PQAVPVSVETIERKDVPNWLRGLGTVQAYYSVQLRARVDGTLIDVPVREGQDVKQGDLLAMIDPRPYQAVLDAALAKKQQDQAQLANAQADLARYASLMKQDFASRQQVDTQTAMVKQYTATLAGDDAQIETARLNLEFCRIVAPFNSRVGLRNIDPGNLVHTNEAAPILSVAQVQPISVMFTLPQDNLPAITRAMATGPLDVVVTDSGNSTELGRGKLVTIDNTVDVATGTIRLKANFDNPERLLWPGQFVNARLLLGVDRNVIAAPAAAIQHGPNGLFVYKLDPASSTVAVQPIKTVRQEGNTYVVADGLTDGTVVVTGGQSRLQNGTKVAIKDNAAQPAKSGS
ncbi:MAG: efflux RND transporter periplasmic adaptor subunit, partial [Mycobacterium sp.]|nr:efflux RND transporter periplasmic adaptor subunit [Mycobacterium sp.]